MIITIIYFKITARIDFIIEWTTFLLDFLLMFKADNLRNHWGYIFVIFNYL